MTRTLLLLAALSAATARAATTIDYATWDGTRQQADEALIAAFNKSQSDVTVKYNLVPWGVYWQKAAAMVAGGSTYDVMWMNLDNFPFYQSQGALSPITLDAKTAALLPATRTAPYRVNNQLYGVPLGPQPVTVYINRSLFKERGVPIPTTTWTYAQMLDAAKKLTFTKDGKQIYGINGADLQADLEYGMSFYYGAGGQGLIKKTGDTYAPNLDATFQKTSQMLLDLIYKDKVSPGPQASTQQGYQMFLAGQMGILVQGSWMVSTWDQNKDLDWAFAPFPSVDGRAPRPVVSAHALVIPKGSRNAAAAQKFVTWMNTSTQAQRMLAQRGLLPTLAETYKSQYLAALPGRNAQTVFAQLPNSVVINANLRSLKSLPEVLTVLNQKLNLAWTGNAKLPDAISQASAGMADLLKQSK
ncbi:multiple sugar transport system substrate-binding protein [Deinococcus metalli]|uniref:ABC transporter substrate-binding protein n=1 Tax=Deinococcus metalli TaxID=1141878 RepID=A0A7W8KEI1_9DEIO|nr:sugar ABC transporter substrate-binding protein [Deinococcus metalli]MBB5375638.1 multiple sugar transport system substrate-binding protein [Deinococcus metalli]GHF38175.1 ABC transporter substrate-binding protein [Deinococcus metalli]